MFPDYSAPANRPIAPLQLIQQFLAQDSAQKIRTNRNCATIVIEYDRNRPGILADLMNRLRRARSLEALQASLEALQASMEALQASMEALQASMDALQARNGTGIEIVLVETIRARQPSRLRIPLVLPTASFILSFCVGPLVVGLNIPLMLWNARPIGRRAWRVLRYERRLNVDFLDALAISVSMLHSAFLTAAIIVWLVRPGDWIRDLTAARSKRAVSELLEFQKQMAWLLKGGVIHAIPASLLVAGDTVVAHSGEMIPVDGEILTGHGTIDQKTITGESLPVPRTGRRRLRASVSFGRTPSLPERPRTISSVSVRMAAHPCFWRWMELSSD